MPEIDQYLNSSNHWVTIKVKTDWLAHWTVLQGCQATEKQGIWMFNKLCFRENLSVIQEKIEVLKRDVHRLW